MVDFGWLGLTLVRCEMSGGFGITSKLEILSQICRFARELPNKKSDHVSKNPTAIHTLQESNQPSFPQAPRQNPSNLLMLRAHWPPWRPKSFVVASTCLGALGDFGQIKKNVHRTMQPNFDVLTYISYILLTPLGRDIAGTLHWSYSLGPSGSVSAMGTRQGSRNWTRGPLSPRIMSLTKSLQMSFLEPGKSHFPGLFSLSP